MPSRTKKGTSTSQGKGAEQQIPGEVLEELAERLADLRHDLGKHIRLPLALLRADAPAAEVREALATGLLRTRRGPDGVRTARQLWEKFCRETGGWLGRFAGWASLERAVERALAWEGALLPGAPEVDRAAADADLAALTPALRALEAELDRGR